MIYQFVIASAILIALLWSLGSKNEDEGHCSPAHFFKSNIVNLLKLGGIFYEILVL